MKKRKWILAALAVPALAIGVLWVDSYSRAVAAIRAEDDRLVKDIAAFRSRLSPPVASVPFKSRYEVERGISGRDTWSFIREFTGRSHAGFRAPGAPVDDSSFSLEGAIDALAASDEALRECGFMGVHHRESFQGGTLDLLRRRMKSGVVRSEELRGLAAALDRILAARPGFAQVLEAQFLLERAEILRVLHLRADPRCFFRRTPGWRDFYSWRIHVVNSLKELEERHEILRGEEAQPLRNWYIGINLMVPELERTRSEFEEVTDALRKEIAGLADWQFTRVVVALARFRAEHGILPAALAELVPGFMTEIPVHPFDHSPMVYENGKLKIQPSQYGDSIEWP